MYSGPSASDFEINTPLPTETKLLSNPDALVESRIRFDARNSNGMRLLTEIYPEAGLAQVFYKYGWDKDEPNNGFDPATKNITITLDVGHVENEMKYMARSNPDALACRATVRTTLEELCVGEKLPVNIRPQLLEIAMDLASDPMAVQFGSQDFKNLSFLGFSQVQELVEAGVVDKLQRQKIYRSIYGLALAGSQFAITTMEGEGGSIAAGAINIEVHERTHFVNDRNFPTHLPDEELLKRVETLRTQFFTDEPLTVKYDSVADKTEKEITNDELVQINHRLMNAVVNAIGDDPQAGHAYLKVATRNARDEVIAMVFKSMAGESTHHIRAVAFAKYATSGYHYFDRDPNLDIVDLQTKIAGSDTPEKKRQIIMDYFQNGFKDK